ncbi:MAG: GerAB/ArcD/ProY family transporter [Clostridia bacterium]|nr:GerAB/ArcD/ProY family transporter [Clostridia bacterium]
MRLSKLETLEAIALIVIIMANKIILNLPKSIITSTGSAGWLNSIYVSLIAILFAYVVTRLFKNFSGQDILDVSNYLGGKFLKASVGILYILFFIIICILIIRNFSETLKIIYFTTSPIIFLILFFVIAACITNKFGIKVISKINLIIAPAVFISIFVIFFSTIKNFIPQRLFPILGYGVNETFFSGLTNLFGFTGLAYLLFLQPLLKNNKDFKKISIISFVISSILLCLSVTCLLLVFSFVIDANENVSIYLLTRMVRYGDVIQRVNALFIFIWILSIISYISITLFFATHITKKLTNLTNTNTLTYCYGSIILAVTMLFQDFAGFLAVFEKTFRITSLILIFGISILILILANLKYKFLKKK